MPEASSPAETPVETPAEAPRKMAIVGEIPFAGRALARTVAASGLSARVLCPDSGAEAALMALPHAQNIEIVRGDLASAEAIAKTLDGVHGVCFVSPIGMSGRIYRAEPHLDDVRRVVHAAETQALRKLVYHSSVGANSAANSRALRDAAAAEELVNQSRCEDFRVRTGPLMGKGDGFLTEIVARARAAGPFMSMLGYGGTLVQPLHVDDFSRCLARIFNDRPTMLRNGLYSLGGPETRSLLELTDTALQLAGRFKIKFHQPLFGLQLLRAVNRNPKFIERVGLLLDALALEKSEVPSFLGENAKLITPKDAEEEIFSGLARA